VAPRAPTSSLLARPLLRLLFVSTVREDRVCTSRRAARRPGLRPDAGRRGWCARATSEKKAAAGDPPALARRVGTPTQCARDTLRRFGRPGRSTQVIFVLQAGATARSHIMESGSSCRRDEVLPELPKRDGPRLRRGRATRYGHRGRDGPRAESYEPVDIGDYAFPALPRQWAGTHDDALAATLDRWGRRSRPPA